MSGSDCPDNLESKPEDKEEGTDDADRSIRRPLVDERQDRDRDRQKTNQGLVDRLTEMDDDQDASVKCSEREQSV